MKSFIAALISFSLTFGGLYYYNNVYKVEKPTPKPVVVVQQPIVPPRPKSPNLTTTQITSFLPRESVVNLMKEWAREAPDLCKFGSYGKTKYGTDCNYLRMGTKGKPKILMHSCIHGNERLACASMLNIMAKLLNGYGKRDKETWLLANRDIFFVPMLSPDTYLRSRHVEGVDPNRNYPCPENPNIKSTSPILRVREFCNREKFTAVLSGHTYGRIYLYPRFDFARNDLGNLAREMGKISNYRSGAIGGGYPTRNSSSRGYEIDYYSLLGAASILTEFGNGNNGGHHMPASEILTEVEKTYEAHLLFMKKAPDIKLNVPSEWQNIK